MPQMAENEKELREMDLTWKQKLAEAEQMFKVKNAHRKTIAWSQAD